MDIRRIGADEMLNEFEICYHGTVDIKGLMIRNDGIDLSVPIPGTDFGQGFYLTNNQKQVEEWAQKKAIDANAKNSWINARPVVLKYRADTNKLNALDGKIFENPSLEWGQFIFENRMYAKMYYDLSYDYAIGPVADGFMRTLMNMLKADQITMKEFIKNITPSGDMSTYNQISFHSIDAIDCLTLKEVEYIEEV